MAKKFCVNCGGAIPQDRDVCDACIKKVLNQDGKSKDIKVKG